MDGIDWTGLANGAGAAAQPFQVWVLPVLLGLGLASATGFRTFLPLLMLAVAARFELFGVQLNDHFAWLGSLSAIGALGLAATAEFLGDKIPVVDHALNAIGWVTRPLAAALAAGGMFWALDPTAAAIAGVIVGAPTALLFTGAQGGARLTSTATTGGVFNPVVSFIEDALAVGMVFLTFLAPILVPILLIGLLVLIYRLGRSIQRARTRLIGERPDPV
ncbi:MAG: DUF4126 domain-containing protein [Brevundimonas sp.]|nr:MAG: DUF4126 domain-containing protein [Brevundimonas sp.]